MNKKTKDQKISTPSSGNILKYFEKKKIQAKQEEEKEERNREERDKEAEIPSKEDKTLKKKDEEVTPCQVLEENPDVKKTFTSIDRKTFKDTISKFKKMSREIDCAIRSGFCSSHNCRVVRKITSKKMSYIGDNGRLLWRMCEVAILACPYKQIPGQPRAPTEHVQSIDESKGANQKRRKLEGKFECTMDQSHPRKTKSQVKEDRLLEETN